MKIQAIKIEFSALGQPHTMYDERLRPEEEYEQEIKKIHSLAHITSISHDVITTAEMDEKSFARLQARNSQLEQHFSHIDNEALEDHEK